MDFTDGSHGDLMTDAERIIQELLGGQVQPKIVKVFSHAQLDLEASKAAGRRIYHEQPFILIRYTSSDDGVSRPVTEEDKRRFPSAWAAYLRERETGSKTQVSILPACDVSIRQELTDMGIFTVEELLDAADTLGEHMRDLIRQAKKWRELNDEESTAED